MIFVFGSNEAGRHGAGAADWAYRHEGAEMGVGFGRRGNSFAIPTKDKRINTLPIPVIRVYVNSFIEYAYDHIDEAFKVTRIGCGYAGYTDLDMAPLFEDCPANCSFDDRWKRILGEHKSYWGTF